MATVKQPNRLSHPDLYVNVYNTSYSAYPTLLEANTLEYHVHNIMKLDIH